MTVNMDLPLRGAVRQGESEPCIEALYTALGGINHQEVTELLLVFQRFCRFCCVSSHFLVIYSP